MRSKIAQRIMADMPDSTKQKVKEYAMKIHDESRKHQVRKAVERRNSLKIELQLLSAIFIGGLVVLTLLLLYAFVDEIWKDLDFHPMSGMVLLVISSAGVLILNRKR
jgi:hypothetical protein